MTVVAGTTETYDSAALKESLDPVIWDLFPMDTYFSSNVDKEKVTNTQHQWLYDSLTAASNNKQIEGDDVTYATLATAARVSNYTQIARGPFQSCILGYAIDGAFERRGLMQEALAATIAHAFDVMQLHRIQASYIPANVRSGRLLQRLGFRREGVAPKYLFINGEWRDHVITALLNPQFDDSVFQTLER